MSLYALQGRCLHDADASGRSCPYLKAYLRVRIVLHQFPCWSLKISGLHPQMLNWLSDRKARSDKFCGSPPIPPVRPKTASAICEIRLQPRYVLVLSKLHMPSFESLIGVTRDSLVCRICSPILILDYCCSSLSSLFAFLSTNPRLHTVRKTSSTCTHTLSWFLQRLDSI